MNIYQLRQPIGNKSNSKQTISKKIPSEKMQEQIPSEKMHHSRTGAPAQSRAAPRSHRRPISDRCHKAPSEKLHPSRRSSRQSCCCLPLKPPPHEKNCTTLARELPRSPAQRHACTADPFLTDVTKLPLKNCTPLAWKIPAILSPPPIQTPSAIRKTAPVSHGSPRAVPRSATLAPELPCLST